MRAITGVALIQETAALQIINLNKIDIDKMKQTHSQTTTVLTSTPRRLSWIKRLIALRRCEWPMMYSEQDRYLRDSVSFVISQNVTSVL